MILLREKGLTEQQIVTALVNDLKESFLNSQLGLAEHQIDEESLKNRILKELTDKF